MTAPERCFTDDKFNCGYFTAQTANVMEWQDSSGKILASIGFGEPYLVGERGEELIFSSKHIHKCAYCGLKNDGDARYCGQGIEPAGCGAPC